MAWRVYRLPGSRGVWHIDSGPETQILNVRGIQIQVLCWSVDAPEQHPRGWIQIDENSELYIVQGVAVWVASVRADVSADAVSADAVQDMDVSADAVSADAVQDMAVRDHSAVDV